MENNPQSENQPTNHQVDDPLQLKACLTKHNIEPGSILLLALSGGVDSVVLLHQLHTLQDCFSFKLHAMHVHHGLSPNADLWAAHCQILCQQYKVPFTIARVHVTNQGGGLEAAARQARYQALLNYKFQTTSPNWIVTAHHQADQAETVLLQLFRGAGVKGLSAMPSVPCKRLLRPFLSVPKHAIDDYAIQHKLNWCEDESNQDLQFDRNFIRQQVIPSLKARYPSLYETLAKTASQMSETQILLTELAQQDAHGMIDGECLNVAGLARLSDLRFRNVLRFWFECRQLDMPSSRRLTEISKQLRYAKSDAAVRLQHHGHILLRYDGSAYLYHASALPEFKDFELCWNGEDSMTLSNGCIVHFEHVIGRGIAVEHLSLPLLIKSRSGGERLKLYRNRPEKPLKQWFQDAKVPPWAREVTPLFYMADQLVFVPGVGVAEDFKAANDQAGLMITLEFVKNYV